MQQSTIEKADIIMGRMEQASMYHWTPMQLFHQSLFVAVLDGLMFP
jgi:hypothetical protein